MYRSIASMVPDAQTVLELQPEELAGVVIEFLNSLSPAEQQKLNRHNFMLIGGEISSYPPEFREGTEKAFSEAWAWLERECLVAPMPRAAGGWVFVTRRGRKLIDRDAYENYRRAAALPRALLHPRIDAHSYPSFLRGAYDTAIFEAFREVEIAVRAAGGFGPEMYGVQLMRDAFGPPDGPLADKTTLVSEQEATANLFAGAIGLYKNPTSHRAGIVTDPAAAAEVVTLASHLLRLVEARHIDLTLRTKDQTLGAHVSGTGMEG